LPVSITRFHFAISSLTHVTIEQQDAVLQLEYPTLADIKADLIANGLPVDHLLKLPKLIEHKS
jgi:hypothetical protein